jgi:hypothetical protein
MRDQNMMTTVLRVGITIAITFRHHRHAVKRITYRIYGMLDTDHTHVKLSAALSAHPLCQHGATTFAKFSIIVQSLTISYTDITSIC